MIQSIAFHIKKAPVASAFLRLIMFDKNYAKVIPVTSIKLGWPSGLSQGLSVFGPVRFLARYEF